MSMTKKHFTMLADTINEIVNDPNSDLATLTALIARLIPRLEEINPSFDRGRFIDHALRRDTVSQTETGGN